MKNWKIKFFHIVSGGGDGGGDDDDDGADDDDHQHELFIHFFLKSDKIQKKNDRDPQSYTQRSVFTSSNSSGYCVGRHFIFSFFIQQAFVATLSYNHCRN